VLDQHAGRLRFGNDEVQRWQRLLEARRDFVEGELGAAYLFMVVPDSHAVYPEKLPADFRPVDERPVHQIAQLLEERNSPVRILYPLEELRAAKEHGLVYSPVDSHWTEYGCFVAYHRVLDAIESRVAVRRLDPSNVAFVNDTTSGDLGYKAGRSGPTLNAQFRPAAQLVEDNRIENTGTLVILECESAPATTCLLVGDSYSRRMLPFFGESFRRLVFTQTPVLDRELAKSFRPDVVLNLMAERFLVGIPDDETGPRIADLVKRKVAAGRIRERFDAWDGGSAQEREPPSPAMVERIRARLLADGGMREATLVTALAYGGLRPREALWLRWGDVQEGALDVPAIPAPPGAEAGGAADSGARTVQLLGPLRDDFSAWRRACGDPDDGYVFAGAGGRRWSPEEWQQWLVTDYADVVAACGIEPERLEPRVLRRTGEGLPHDSAEAEQLIASERASALAGR
jgi:integrase